MAVLMLGKPAPISVRTTSYTPEQVYGMQTLGTLGIPSSIPSAYGPVATNTIDPFSQGAAWTRNPVPASVLSPQALGFSNPMPFGAMTSPPSIMGSPPPGVNVASRISSAFSALPGQAPQVDPFAPSAPEAYTSAAQAAIPDTMGPLPDVPTVSVRVNPTTVAPSLPQSAVTQAFSTPMQTAMSPVAQTQLQGSLLGQPVAAPAPLGVPSAPFGAPPTAAQRLATAQAILGTQPAPAPAAVPTASVPTPRPAPSIVQAPSVPTPRPAPMPQAPTIAPSVPTPRPAPPAPTPMANPLRTTISMPGIAPTPMSPVEQATAPFGAPASVPSLSATPVSAPASVTPGYTGSPAFGAPSSLGGMFGGPGPVPGDPLSAGLAGLARLGGALPGGFADFGGGAFGFGGGFADPFGMGGLASDMSALGGAQPLGADAWGGGYGGDPFGGGYGMGADAFGGGYGDSGSLSATSGQSSFGEGSISTGGDAFGGGGWGGSGDAFGGGGWGGGDAFGGGGFGGDAFGGGGDPFGGGDGLGGDTDSDSDSDGGW